MIGMRQWVVLVLLVLAVGGMTGCGGKDLDYAGAEYPPVARVAKVFQPAQVPRTCRVIAEVVALLPANLTGREIENTILAEAGQRGADMVLIGHSRAGSEDETRFLYFGPGREYPFPDFWNGWKFGHSLWKKQGEWLDIGYNELGSASIRYDVPVAMQLALLRCQ